EPKPAVAPPKIAEPAVSAPPPETKPRPSIEPPTVVAHGSPPAKPVTPQPTQPPPPQKETPPPRVSKPEHAAQQAPDGSGLLCTQCGHATGVGSAFCASCGAPVAYGQTMVISS